MRTKLFTQANLFAFVLSLLFLIASLIATRFAVLAQTQNNQSQDDEGPGSRHICPRAAMRNGNCDPNATTITTTITAAERNKQPQYKRVAKQTSSSAQYNKRIKQAKAKAKNSNTKLNVETTVKVRVEDISIDSPKVGITIWKISEARSSYKGERILSHPKQGSKIEYQATRLESDPFLSYGDKVRIGIESPRDGYLYVIDRELYADGTMSNGYMIFPTTRLRDGNNEIKANRPIEFPALTDNPFYFEGKKDSEINPHKNLVGEILSLIITDKPISSLSNFTGNPLEISALRVEAFERDYAGRAEVFELEGGVNMSYSVAERDAANGNGRMLTHNDPVPQTFYLVEDKKNKGLLVTVVLKYQ